jgi:ABC-type branched-subunit amino acid transport system substrate-binding protein
MMPRACRFDLAFVLLLLLAGCVPAKQTTPTAPPQPSRPAPPVVQPLPPPVPSGPLLAGLLVPLSGKDAALGRDLLDAAQLALFDRPEAELVLLPRDAGATPEAARVAAREVLEAGAELLLGPLLSGAAAAVAPVARERGRVVVSFSNDASIASGDVFVLGWRPEEQVERILRHALDQGWRRLGLLAPDDGYGRRAVEAWQRFLRGLGEPAVDAVGIYPASGEATVAVRAFLDRHGGGGSVGTPRFDAILIADGGLRLRQIAALLAFYDIDPAATRLLGTRLWADDPAVLRDPALRGARIAAPDPTAEAAFRRRFAAIYGREPLPLAALGHDAVVAAVAASAGSPRPDLTALLDPRGHDGAVGPFRLRPDGLAEHALAILELTEAGLRLVEPAPLRLALAVR